MKDKGKNIRGFKIRGPEVFDSVAIPIPILDEKYLTILSC